MQKCVFGQIGFDIVLLVFGGNVFGWMLDQDKSFQVLDSFVDYGFDIIDIVDCYFVWVFGNKGGEFEMIIGVWLKVCFGMCDKVKIFIKVGLVIGVLYEGGLIEGYIL